MKHEKNPTPRIAQKDTSSLDTSIVIEQLNSLGYREGGNSTAGWKPFDRYSDWQKIAKGFEVIPSHWSLTPLREKRPYRKDWQTEEPVSRELILNLLENGESGISKKGNPYKIYISGVGLRSGDYSGGLLCIDIDGVSSIPLWNEIKGDNEDPITVTWTSGKAGRQQRAYQVPSLYWEALKDFNRHVVKEINDVKTVDGEILEFRYNRCQSVLPPSYHPTTGSYQWINSPQDTEVAIAPDWLCEFILAQINVEKNRNDEIEREREVKRQQWANKRQELANAFDTWHDDIDFCRHLLNFIDPDLPYADWIKVGMALSSVSDVLLSDFDYWSSKGSKYKGYRDIESQWRSYRNYNNVGIGTLVYYAKESGFEFPERDSNKDKVILQGVAAIAKAKDNVITSTLERKTSEFLKWIKSHTKASKFLGKKKGFGENKPKEPQITLKYGKDPIPTFEEWFSQFEKPPKIIFKKGDRLKAWPELTNKGWYPLDKSAPGLGKSYDAGRLCASEDNSIFYQSSKHRNPSTDTIKDNYHDLNPRHDGLWRDPVDRELKRALTDEHKEQAEVPSNCHLADLFNNLKDKNYQIDSVPGQKAPNPICATCKYYKIKEKGDDGETVSKCGSSRGDGYGYLFERKEALEKRQIRAHPDSLPEPQTSDSEENKKYDYSNTLFIVEEAGQLIKGIKTITAKWTDLLDNFGEVEDNFPHIYELIKPLKKALRAIFNGEVCQGRYGLNDQQLKENLPSISDEIKNQLSESLPQIESLLKPHWEEIILEPDTVKGVGGQFRDAGNTARTYFRKEAFKQNLERLENLPVNALSDFLNVWLGLSNGALNVNFDKLTITIPDKRIGNILKAGKSVIFLDATADSEILAKRLDIDSRKIIEIEQEFDGYGNLTVVNVQLEGMGSNNWTELAQKKLKPFIETLRKLEGQNIPLVGLKCYADQLEFNGWYFNHNRGSNDYIGERALAAFGTPRINYGVAQSEYLTLFGSLDGFEAYYEKLLQAEFIQLIGRQRAHLDPSNQYKIYIVGSGLNLDFVKGYGVKLESKLAFEICPEAGTPKQVVNQAILSYLGQLANTQQELTKVSDKQIANNVGFKCDRSTINRHFGNKEFKLRILKSVQTCISKLNKSLHTFDMAMFLEECLNNELLRGWLDLNPLDVVKELTQFIFESGWDEFERLLSGLSPDVRLGLLGMLTAIAFPQFVEVWGGT